MFTEHSYDPINSSNIVKTWSDQLGILGIETEKNGTYIFWYKKLFSIICTALNNTLK